MEVACRHKSPESANEESNYSVAKPVALVVDTAKHDKRHQNVYPWQAQFDGNKAAEDCSCGGVTTGHSECACLFTAQVCETSCVRAALGALSLDSIFHQLSAADHQEKSDAVQHEEAETVTKAL